jgi:mRNA interferase MazF
MKRGDIVTVAVAGDYGKPRPAVIVQSDTLRNTDSVLVCLVTSVQRDTPLIRLAVEPLPANGLHIPSQIMIDKIVAIPRAKCGKVIGRLDAGSMVTLNGMISFILGLAD